MGMAEHESAKGLKEEWLTPLYILQALGPFDLDPCAPHKRPWPMAQKHYTIFDDGLKKPWEGRVWLNPPYGRQTPKWLARLAHHGNGIALVYARTETSMFHEYVWNAADAVFFFKGRFNFYHANGSKAEDNAGAPSVLVAYGHNNFVSLTECGLDGKVVIL